MIRRDLDPAERTQLDMLVLKAWRRDPAQASVDLAELIAEPPKACARPSSRPRPRPAVASSGTLCNTVRSWWEYKAAQFSHEVADAARAGVPQDPPYDEDRMLTRLMREALFHRDSERRHLAAY